MSSTSGSVVVQDAEFLGAIADRVATDLEMIVDRKFHVEAIATERVRARVPGEGQVHISFKLVFRSKDGDQHGCVLVPLPDAISLASYLMMMSDQEVAQSRSATTLDRATKDAMLEVGNFVAGAADAVLRAYLPERSVRSEGCQGVREDVRPAFVYEEGSELVLGRAQARIHEFEPFEMIVLLPDVFAA